MSAQGARLDSFFGSIGRGFRKAFTFSGCDTPGQFWPYAGFLIALFAVGCMAAVVPMITSTFARMQQFAAEHPDQADVVSGPGTYSITIHGNHPELMPDFRPFTIGMGIITIIIVLFIASAVCRRLHDRGWSGALGLAPLPFLLFGLWLLPVMVASVGRNEPDIRLFGLLFLNNLLYLAMLALLVVQLVQAGTRGPNRFGEDPRG